MVYELKLSNDNRITGYQSPPSKEAVITVNELPNGDYYDYLYINNEYVYSPLPEPEPTTEQQIAELKAELAATDYKIIKCSEAQLVGEELPYDIVALHTERQAIRDRINELEVGEV